MKRILVFGCLALAGLAYGDDAADRDKLAGSWDAPDGSRWVLDAKDDAMHLTQLDHDRTVMDIECDTVGRECAVKDSGKSAKVTMYYDGPKLVVIETRGSDIVKRLFHATGDRLDVETVPILPEGKTATAKLSRAVVAHK